MAQTWTTTNTGNVTCEKCGRIYKRTVMRLPLRDSDSFSCVCGNELDSWNSTSMPSYELVSEPDPAN